MAKVDNGFKFASVITIFTESGTATLDCARGLLWDFVLDFLRVPHFRLLS